MEYCMIKGKMCNWATLSGNCSVAACKAYDKVIPLVPFSKLKEYMADEQPTVEEVLAEWLLKTWLKNNTIEELCELLENGEKENG